MDHDVVCGGNTSEQITECHIECSTPAGSHNVGRQWTFDLLDEYSVSRRDLEGGGAVLFEEVRESVGNRSVEFHHLLHHIS